MDEKAPGEKPAPKSDALELSADHDGKTVSVAPGKEIVVRLAGNITTGFGWKIAEITGDAVKSLGEPSYVADKAPRRMVGTGGMFVVKLQAVKPGKSTVKLVYVRPWEKDQPPVKTFTATIEVQAKQEK